MEYITPSLYTVLTGNTDVDSALDRFKDSVIEYLKGGWHLQGGVVVDSNGTIYQAMFHYQGKDREE